MKYKSFWGCFLDICFLFRLSTVASALSCLSLCGGLCGHVSGCLVFAWAGCLRLRVAAATPSRLEPRGWQRVLYASVGLTMSEASLHFFVPLDGRHGPPRQP